MTNPICHVDDEEPCYAEDRIKVMLVDDQPFIAEFTRRLLADQPDIEFSYVEDPAKAVFEAIRFQPTVILQDLIMPGTDGFQTVRQFRTHPETCNIPIVMLSIEVDPAFKAEGFAAGANDYLVKPPDKLELVARLRYHSAAFCSQLKREEAFRRLQENQEKLALANVELRRLSLVDRVTGIANRRNLDEFIEVEWQRGQREKKSLSVLMCDIDFFKQYNDNHGHIAGDECLRKVAAVLAANLRRPADMVARYGGEEFVLVLPRTARSGAMVVAEACRREIEALPSLTGTSSVGGNITISIGIGSMVPSSAHSPLELLALADRALYLAKTQGRNQVIGLRHKAS